MEIRFPARLTIAIALIGATLAPASARAMEPRPWLCRDKPVFSSDKPMQYELSARPGTQWQMFFMQFDPNAAHDGFSITQAREIGLRGVTEKGKLPPGRYFAVALRRRSGAVWICPGYVRESPKIQPGIVAKLCYGESEPACLVDLIVTPDHPMAHLGAGAPAP
jgi:hypothetical protein